MPYAGLNKRLALQPRIKHRDIMIREHVLLYVSCFINTMITESCAVEDE